MKFSVLLPTRNRLEFLRYAISSVQKQDYLDWEIVISDNDSQENIKGLIDSLNDPRIIYLRTDSFLPVTDNWNNALNHASGDYIIMLGDDDCLMKDFFTIIEALIEQYAAPELIYTSGFSYAYPNVYPNCPNGFLKVHGNATFLENKTSPFWLAQNKIFELVQDSFNFKVQFNYNMQYAVIKRSFLASLSPRGSFFQSPYPDYFAMLALMLKAPRVLACPYPMVTVGICPKSFGYYYFNNKEKEGVSILNNQKADAVYQKIEHHILPGANMNTCWLLSLATLKTAFPDLPMEVNYKRYRKLQIVQIVREYFERDDKENISNLWQALSMREKIFAGILLSAASFFPKKPPLLKKAFSSFLYKLASSHAKIASQPIVGTFTNIAEVFESVDPKAFREGSLPIT